MSLLGSATFVIDDMVTNSIDAMFDTLSTQYEVKTGDMEPADVVKLESAKNALREVMATWLKNNLPETEDGRIQC